MLLKSFAPPFLLFVLQSYPRLPHNCNEHQILLHLRDPMDLSVGCDMNLPGVMTARHVSLEAALLKIPELLRHKWPTDDHEIHNRAGPAERADSRYQAML